MNSKVEQYTPIAGIALGGIVFFMMYGCKILEPTFVEWTLSGPDPAQHFLGWHFFRSEPWTFPLGTIKSYVYPEGTSLVYTDSIPLLAIPLKLVSAFLPPLFQFKGFWLLLCYLLQGYFAALLVSRILNHSIMNLLATLFFLLSPVLVARSYYHEALSAHWIILAALYLYFQVDSGTNRIRWVTLLILASMVHFYLLAMSFIILSGYLLRELLQDHKKNLGSVIQFFTTASIL